MPTLVDTDARKWFANETELEQARKAVEALQSGGGEQWTVTRAGNQGVTVPSELSALISAVVQSVARGGTVTVSSMPEDLTTTAAADQLGISRPTLMKLVSGGELPSHKVGSHTRIKSAHVVEFKRARLARQRKAFEELLALEDE